MRVSRRQFTALLLGSIALTGCQQASPAPPKPVAPTAGQAAPAAGSTAPAAATSGQQATKPAQGAAQSSAKPAQKGSLVVALADEPKTLDPTNELGNVGVRMHHVLHDTLIRRDFLDGNKLVPSLATSWQRVNDLTLELKLRAGVEFHDGSTMTSEDVKFTFDRVLNPEQGGEARGYFSGIETIETPDPLTVRVTTKVPDPLLEQRLASYGSWIIPKAGFQKLGNEAFIQSPLGAGPFKLADWKHDSQLTVDVHDKYWGAAPAVRRITFRVIPETATRVSALLTGEVDIITNLPPDQVDTIDTSGSASVRAVQLANAHVLRYDTSRFPSIADVRIRRAMNLAIDRESLAKNLWRGRATVPKGFQFEGEFAYDPNRKPPEYNAEKAKQLLREGSYDGGPLVFRTSPSYYSNGLQAAQAIVEMWKQVGLNAQIEVMEQAAIGQVNNAGGQQITNWSATSALGDPDGYLWRNWGPDNTYQQKGYWKNDEFNRLGAEARTILDKDRRIANYHRMLDIFEEDAPGTVLYIPLESYGLKKGIDWTPYPIYYFDPRAYNLKVTG